MFAMRFQCVGIDTKSLLVVSALHILFAVFIGCQDRGESDRMKWRDELRTPETKTKIHIRDFQRKKTKKIRTNLDRQKTEAFKMDYVSFETQQCAQLYRGRVL